MNENALSRRRINGKLKENKYIIKYEYIMFKDNL